MLLGMAIVAEVSATLCLKAAMDLPWLYGVVVAGYVAAFACLALCLRRGLALGVAYGIWGASGVALTALASAVIFAEAVTPVMWGGIACVAVGVLMIEVGSQTAQAARARRADGLEDGLGAESAAQPPGGGDAR